MIVWLLRAAWLTLPLSAGSAASDALQGWSSGPRVTAAILLWAAWGAGLLAALAPRPIGLTALRALAPAFVVVALLMATGPVSSAAAAGALSATLIVAVLAMHPEVALAAANGVSYGDEQRFPLCTPPALFAGPLPLARVLAVGGLAVGPLLLADGRVVASGFALALGIPLAVLAARALHLLSRRWIVLVPAGVVIVDPMTLADNVLFPRDHVRALRAADRGRAPAGVLDLRLGAVFGSIELVLDREADIVRAGRGRRAATVRATRILVAVVRARQLLETAAGRRVRVEIR